MLFIPVSVAIFAASLFVTDAANFDRVELVTFDADKLFDCKDRFGRNDCPTVRVESDLYAND